MKKILAVIDYQKDFVDGALGFKKAETLEAGIYNKVKEYLDNNNKVVFTYDTHFENYLDTKEGKHLPVPHCYLGSEENTIHVKKEAFGIAPKDMIKLAEELGDIDEIELVGVVSNICVISNVCTFQAQYPNAQITVDSNLCASFDESLHEKVLDVMEGLQVQVIK